MQNITKARGLVFINEGQTAINCEIEHPQFGWIPFTARANDVEARGRAFFVRLLSGEMGAVAPYVAPTEQAKA